MLSMPSVSADASDIRIVLSSDAFTASASMAEPLWNTTSERSLICHVSGSTLVASVASHASGWSVSGERRKRFSDIADWLATHPPCTGSKGLSSQITPAFRVGRSSAATATGSGSGVAVGATVAAGAGCCCTAVAAGASAGGAVSGLVVSAAPQATANARTNTNANGIRCLILRFPTLGKIILRMIVD